MSHLVKKLTIIAIAVFVLLSMSAFAQNGSKLSTMAKADKASKPPKAAAAAPQHTAAKSSQNWMTHRFEISFQGGGVVGGNLGEPDLGACKPAVTSGCDVNIGLSHRNNSVYPATLAGLANFQRDGGIAPGNGGVWGLRMGFNVTPRWQLEFIFNHATTGTEFTNSNLLQQATAVFDLNGFGANQRQLYYFDGDGRPKGNQNMYLFNLNRTFNAGGRVQPYIGGGLGAESWYAGPKLHLGADTRTFFFGAAPAEFTKYPGSATGFAFDMAAGTKIYLTPRFGVRADVMDVISFADLKHNFQTIDSAGILGTPGALAPVSGTVSQSGRFNQTLFTGGVFWAFGKGWENSKANIGSFGEDDFWDHWELSFNFGGVHGSRNGHQASTCTPSVTDGCNADNLLSHDLLTGGVIPTRLQPTLPHFLTQGTFKPGDGWTTGLRLAYNFTPSWDVSFIWNVAGTGSRLENQNLLDQTQQGFYAGFTGGSTPRSFDFINGADGQPRGNQSMYLFNVDRNFHVTRRFVPYIGAGLGLEQWNNNPQVQIHTDLSGSGTPNVADFAKTIKNQMGFAADIAGGAKFYLTRHFGVRADVMNVWSFNTFKSNFESIDTSGLYGTPGAIVPVSGVTKQDANFQQLVATAGAFWTFGKGGTWSASNPLQPGTGAHAGRWELSFQTGGVIGGNLGRPDYGNCKSSAAGSVDGCNPNQPLNLAQGSSSAGVDPTKLVPISYFQRNGGVAPGNGGLFGVRLGYNVTPVWQLEFIWNHAQTQTYFTNKDRLDDALSAFRDPHFEGTGETNKVADFIQNDDASARGNQNTWLFNLNRNFNVSGRVVPYVGLGGGMESWYAGPKMNLFTVSEEQDQAGEFTKFSKGSNGFAWDFATGAKIYITNSFGFRADFMNVMSFPGITNQFQSVDVANLRGFGPGSLVPVSGQTNQNGHFNQAMFTAGVFWSLGGRMDTKGYSSPSGDRESLNDHWELSYNFGGTHGGAFGSEGTSCAAAVAGGCDYSASLGHDDNPTISVFPNRIKGSLPNFMAQGGVKPGDGYTSGFEIGYNLTPDWQISFLWNTLGTGTRFDNQRLLDTAESAFTAGGRDFNPATSARSLSYLQGADGTPRGNQQQWLVNLNRNFNTHSRIVPYFGAGMGAVNWAGNPRLFLQTISSRIDNGTAWFVKSVPNTTGFGLDLAGGLKFYVARHWGLRADMLNVTSFQTFHPTFAAIDVSGQLGTPGAILPVAGKLSQSTRFNQTSGTGGIFFTF